MVGISVLLVALAESGGKRTIGPVRHVGNVRFERWNECEVADRVRMREGQGLQYRDRRHTVQVAHGAIIVERAQLVGRVTSLGVAGLALRVGVLVFMVPKMRRELACFVLAFVLTVAPGRRPGKLERQQDEQEDRQPAAHH